MSRPLVSATFVALSLLSATQSIAGQAEEEDQIVFQTSSFLARFGLGEPDQDFKVAVAIRRGVLAAVIAEKCTRIELINPSADRFRRCLVLNERVETELGNKLDEPAKN